MLLNKEKYSDAEDLIEHQIDSKHVLYICNVGSVVMGTSKFNSDYDFLVLHKDKELSDSFKTSNKDIEITYLYYKEALRLCTKPSSKDEFSRILEVVHMLKSTDYIGSKEMHKLITKDVPKYVNLDSIRQKYLERYIELFNFDNDDNIVNIKRYLTCIYVCLSLRYMNSESDLHPNSLYDLMSAENNKNLISLSNRVLYENKQWSLEMEDDSENVDHYSFKLIKATRNEIDLLQECLEEFEDRNSENMFSSDSNLIDYFESEVIRLTNK